MKDPEDKAEDEAILSKLCETGMGELPERISRLKAHASPRRRYRILVGGRTWIGVRSSNVQENQAFIGFSRHFRKHGLPVPEISLVSDDVTAYLEEDLGDRTLFDLLMSSRKENEPFPALVEEHYQQALRYLPRFQIEAAADLDYSLCPEGTEYDRSAIENDLANFMQHFVEKVGAPFVLSELQNDFKSFVDLVSDVPNDFFMYRDFQARNIMVRENSLAFIDFQSGRKGPLQCDVASLLYQSQAALPGEVRQRLLNGYLAAVGEYREINEGAFRRHYSAFVYLRLMQVLGAYGRAGLGERKDYFLHGIPVAIQNLLNHLEENDMPVDLPALKALFQQLESYDEETNQCQVS